MKIGIFSDIHDNIWNLQAVLSYLQATDMLICLGDLCSPFIIPMLGRGFAGPIKLVLGNNDGDLFRITMNAGPFKNIAIAGEMYQDLLDGLRIAAIHYDNIGLDLARSNQYDLVLFGHNHQYQVEKISRTLAVNPGTLMGYNPIVNQEVPATFVIFDTQDGNLSSFQVIDLVGRQKSIRTFPKETQ